MKNVLLIICSLFIISFTNYSKGDKKEKRNLQKVTDQKSYTFLDINNIATYFYNNGKSDITPNGNSGFFYPKGTGKAAVFTSGLLWGAKVAGDPNPRVGGTAYRTGLKPGIIQSDGTAADPTSDKYRIYRVRKDVYPGGPFVDLSLDAIIENNTKSEIREDYERDWTEWPADLGAPFDDKNQNGIYEPTLDIPGFPGADQTIWFVANDLDTTQTKSLYGANPLGIEMQTTAWAYNQPGPVGNMLFRKYKLINKTGTGNLPPVTFDSMYISMWSDVDLGEAGDDFVGTDTTLNLVYTYNANERDNTYYPLPPPAIGFSFLQGPLVDGNAGEDRNNNSVDDGVDFGIYNGKKVGPGKINLPMTASYYFVGGDPNISDPPQGIIIGAIQFYNYFQGKLGITGEPFINFVTGLRTNYVLTGDPQTGTGWLDGMQLPPGDRRMGIASGPFTMAPSDSKEIVFAEVIGGAVPGSDRLSAIGDMKASVMIAKFLYDNNFESFNPPQAPQVKAVELDKKIILDWGEDVSAVLTTETNSKGGFTFQGYNVYQLPSPTSTLSEATRLATFDKIDGVLKILETYFDPIAGAFLKRLAQFGNDSGIKHSFTVTVDSLHFDSNGKGLALKNGIKYYYAVTAYSYNPGDVVIPNNFESEIEVLTVTPHIQDPGITREEPGTITPIKIGLGTVVANVKIVNPDLLTGHDYEIFFEDITFTQTPDLIWHLPKFSTSKFAPTGVNDISPSTMAFTSSFSGDGSINVDGKLTLSSPDFDFADGIRVDFPAGITINSGVTVTGCANSATLIPVIAGQSILWGDSSRSTFGCFIGGETVKMNVSGALPFSLNWTVYDDGYGDLYAGTTLGIKDAHGSASLGNPTFLEHTWGLKDATLGTRVLQHQTVFGGKDWYFGTGPGGSSPAELGGNVGANYSATVEGLEISIDDLTFDPPITFLSARQIQFGGSTSLSLWGDAMLFGNPTGLTFFGDHSGATHEDLIQDLELRFTGQAPDNDSPVTSRGQMATMYNRDLVEALATRIRAPFELWEVERNKQINYWLISRNADGGAPWDRTTGVPKWYRMLGRDYIIPYPTDYNENATPAEVGQTGNHSTWLLFFRQGGDAQWSTGDVFLIKYANNVIPGQDKFEFSTKAKTYNAEKAKTDVEKINVFPNPYYAKSSDDLIHFERFVKFTHLPVKAKIRIFNLGGILVRVIDKDDNSQFIKWDLLTSHGFLVGSGIYIVYIEMPDLGKSKILKVAIVQGIPINNFSK